MSDLHKYHLKKSLKHTKHLSKKSVCEGLPPNKFYEQIYELTINPIQVSQIMKANKEFKELDDLKDSVIRLLFPDKVELPPGMN